MATKKQFFDFSTKEEIIPVVKVAALPEVNDSTIVVNDDFDTCMSKINRGLEWKTPHTNIQQVDPQNPNIGGEVSPTPFNPLG